MPEGETEGENSAKLTGGLAFHSLVAVVHSSHKASYSNFDFDTVLTLLLGL